MLNQSIPSVFGNTKNPSKFFTHIHDPKTKLFIQWSQDSPADEYPTNDRDLLGQPSIALFCSSCGKVWASFPFRNHFPEAKDNYYVAIPSTCASCQPASIPPHTYGWIPDNFLEGVPREILLKEFDWCSNYAHKLSSCIQMRYPHHD